METGWKNSFCCGTDGSTGTITGGDDIVGQNCNFTNNAWDIRDISTTSAVTPQVGTRCYDYSNHATPRVPESSVVQALLFGNGVGSSYTHHNIPDPHMMCLKLGKRHYCDCLLAAELSSDAKRVKPPPYPTTVWASSPVVRVTSLPTTVVPRCQVEGCHVALANSKDYYKRHKVCEIHSKAPKVVVLGLQQRFCQQCSRFHGVTEFDGAKRSCRRRLEGHNQRRRKGTPSNSLPRNFPHSHENDPKIKPGCALSLLSSPKTEPWISSDDLSSRCSAALCELIAANRATYYVGHFMNQKSSNQQVIENTIHTLPPTHMWDRFSVVDPKNTTLNLMQAPALDFDILSMKEKSKDSEEWTDYCWSTFGGANVV